MKNVFKSISILVCALLFFSCSSDSKSDYEEPINEPDTEIELELVVYRSGAKGSHGLDGSLLYEFDYTSENTKELYYVIHNKKDDSFLKINKLTKKDIVFDSQNNIVLTEKLDAGEYYISIVSWVSDYNLSNNSVELLKKPYNEAIFVTDPHQITFAGTQEFKISMSEKQRELMEMKQMSSPFDFIFYDTEDIPYGSKVDIVTTIKNLPTTFYLKTQKTLSLEEEAKLGITSFEEETQYKRKPDSRLMGQYFVLNNMHLPETTDARGIYNVNYNIEQSTAPMQIGRSIDVNIPESAINVDYQSGGNSYYYGLYDLGDKHTEAKAY